MMLQIRIRALCSAVAVAAAGLLAVPAVGRAQEVVVLVDGEPITALDIEQRAKFIQMSTQKAPNRKEVLDGLIDEVLEIREAKKFGIDVPAAEVDNAFANVGNRMGADAAKLTQMLAKGGASAETLKHRLKAELAWNALVKGRYKSSLEVADSDVEAQLDLHKPQDKNEVGYEYVLRPVLFVVQRGSPDAAFEARKKDADALRLRFLSCAEGIPFARALREVAVRDQVTKFSADLPPRATYDVALCMYHDQALIPIKTLAFDHAVNVTLGLPFVRTSPDHGTAFDIAGTGRADPTSLVAALRLAARLAMAGSPASLAAS